MSAPRGSKTTRSPARLGGVRIAPWPKRWECQSRDRRRAPSGGPPSRRPPVRVRALAPTTAATGCRLSPKQEAPGRARRPSTGPCHPVHPHNRRVTHHGERCAFGETGTRMRSTRPTGLHIRAAGKTATTTRRRDRHAQRLGMGPRQPQKTRDCMAIEAQQPARWRRHVRGVPEKLRCLGVAPCPPRVRRRHRAHVRGLWRHQGSLPSAAPSP